MEGIMFPSEMVILMAIAVAREPDKKLLSRPMDVTGEYIGYLCSSLVKRGFLKENRPKGYQLTAKGMKTVFEFLSRNKDKAEDAKKMLRQLGIEIGREIGKLEKEAIRVR
jgi:predicted transcriptional regulator